MHTTKTIFTFLIILLVLNVSATPPAFAAWFGTGSRNESSETTHPVFSSLSEMADSMAKELKDAHPGIKLKLCLDKEDIREDQELRNVPFADMLTNELERAFSRAGFSFEAHNLDNTDYLISVNYHRTTENVAVYLKLKKVKDDSYRNMQGNYQMSLQKLPRDCFFENLDSKLARLSSRVSQGWNKSGALSLLVTPVVEARRKYSSPFSEYATGKLKTNFSNLPTFFRLIEEKPTAGKSAPRSVEKSADLSGTDARIAGANAVLEGVYLRGIEMVNISLTMKDLKGNVLASADENIPLGLITFSLDNDIADNLALIADTEHENSRMVRVSTTKGGNYQVFRNGETVNFTVQVSKPLYVYLYDINPNGEVTLLSPKLGEPEYPRLPGLLYSIPEASDSWEIKVEAPFGKDAVKLFASDHRLPIPKINGQAPPRSIINGTRGLNRVDKVQKELVSQPVINGLDLVDYYKGAAIQAGTTLYESTVFIETREN